MSVVYYVVDGDDLLVSTMRGRAKAREEDRVVIRLRPEWSVYTPPVHLHAGDDGSKMQHGLAERMAWR